jgi:hypothetical protein
MEKKHMMIIDLLDTNNWDRPIYFSITIGNSSHSFSYLWDYFQLDGLAYRFVPIKTKSEAGKIGRVESEVLYTNLMEKFEYGNMNGEDVYMDETNLRLVMNIRNNFSRLADKLINEGDTARAIDVLDRCIDLMPHEKVEYNFFMLPIAESYYACKQTEKARAVVSTMQTMFDEKLNYFAQFEGDDKGAVQNDIQRSLSLYNSIVRLTLANDEGAYADDLASDFQTKMKTSNFR